MQQTRTIVSSPRFSSTISALRRYIATDRSGPRTTERGVHGSTLRRHKDDQIRKTDRSLFDSNIQPSNSKVLTAVPIKSTITPSEQKAFEAILSAPSTSVKEDLSTYQSPYLDAVDTDVDRVFDLFSTFSKPHQAVKPIDDDGTNLGWIVDENERPSPVLTPSGSVAARNAARLRMSSIVNALRDAAASTDRPGDISLWHACESHIFSLMLSDNKQVETLSYKAPKFIGPAKFTYSPEHSDVPVEIIKDALAQHRAKWQVSRTASSLPTANSTKPPTDTGRSRKAKSNLDSESLAVLYHVYPATLLYALRLFNKEFPYSHFAFNLLPRIRELGQTSYVLGASPQFYNTLISIKWQRSSMLREVDKLLLEMEEAGLEFDEETYRILRQIKNEHFADLNPASGPAASEPPKGSRGASWWQAHEQRFWFPRILRWMSIVKLSLDNRTVEGGRMESALGSLDEKDEPSALEALARDRQSQRPS